MAMKLIRTQAGDGIFVNLIKDDRFKHNRIAVNFILPLARETATGYALLPFLMQRGYAGCSDFTAFARKLDELYGATVAGKVSKAGNYQIITLTITHVDDRYTLNGEPLAEECARLLAEIVTMPAIENGRFDPEAVATEKNSLADTIAAEVNDKRSYAVTRCTELLFEGEPLAVKQYGYAEDVDASLIATLIDQFKRLFRSFLAKFIVVFVILSIIAYITITVLRGRNKNRYYRRRG